ncbi:ABC transporter substrate-binding protein [Aminithiophilus ramosus]|uniref:ABC transporter substrate-binding protein n=2 Tax=Synergistales TaxID=649776 RepID=A0A9Q7A6M2_9BACT|nr:ABC transporter substrate-binding protein [Aminithiophilus ramosus]QTX31876.1 ABC transporter substrate-binding protein [Aminithiophilus ramosus]QVL35713.1 ABC transporter substrate-binding protein [Synergistota bacterium]
MKRKGLLLFLCALLAVGSIGGAAFAADQVRIGVVAPITGQNAIGGQYIKNGVELAVKEFAPDGLDIGGKIYEVKVLFEDNENKPDITANAFRKLIDQNEVVAIVGPDASSTSLAGGPIAQSAEVPVVTTFATNPKVTEVGDYIFRACFIDPFQGSVMAKYVMENLKVTKAAVLYNNGNDFSKGLTEYFKQNFEAMGGEIVALEAYGGSDIRDFNAQLNNIKASGAEVLYLPNAFFETGLQMNQARKAGINVPFVGGDGWDSPDLPKIAAGAEEGAAFTAAFSHEAKRPEVQAFVEKYQQTYGTVPNSNAVLSYEATAIVLRGLRDAGKVSGPALRDAIAAIDIDLPSGKIKFDEKRNPQKAAVIMQFAGGTTTYVTTINP